MKIKLLYVVAFYVISFSLNSQNLLNTNTWTVGSGSVSGFGQNGSTSENTREYGVGPDGTNVLLWKASPDASSNADGGWNSSYSNIDHTKTYRLIVWLKKTNSNSGTSYFGFHSPDNGLKLDGVVNNNPYFWYGDLPELNKWYMLVGFVHGSTYNSTVNYGAIYDSTTGQKVRDITDYKFKDSATVLRHRTYLYYDTNTSDRQYFFAPRMELVDGNEPSIQELLSPNNTDNNLLDTSVWTVGCGSVSGFSQNGTTSENCRELGKNHVGDEVVLWKATPDASSNNDGGWNSTWKPATNTTSYRYSVWIKKMTSNNGSTYFGFYANNSGSLRLDGSYNSNPYFFAGDLPKLNRWYLLVGYVHKSSHTGTTNTGGIYDGITGEKVRTITDYKLKNNVTALRHRSYLFYDTNTLDRQYFWEPRIDPITGNEPTIDELLMINENSKLIVSYDNAGNQKQRFYCEEEGFCSPQAPTSKKGENDSLDSDIFEDENIDSGLIEHSIYPNPTTGIVSIKLSGDNNNLTGSISIFNANGSQVKKIEINKPRNQVELDLQNLPVGVYFVHMHFTSGKIITEKIIKK